MEKGTHNVGKITREKTEDLRRRVSAGGREQEGGGECSDKAEIMMYSSSLSDERLSMV